MDTAELQGDDHAERERAASDTAALQRIRGGETAAFELIMRRYNQRLFRVARSILRDEAEAQDAMQEAYVHAYFSLDRFTGPERLGAWLTRITINEALMRRRKRRREQTNGDDVLAGVEPRTTPAENPEHRTANMQLRQMIEEAVDTLSEEFRTVFVLRACEQLNVRETAACLGIPEATVKTRFHRARRQVQERLRRELDRAQMEVFEFAGRRCDAMVHRVLARLSGHDPGSGEVH